MTSPPSTEFHFASHSLGGIPEVLFIPDSLYTQARNAEWVERDPDKAIRLYQSTIDSTEDQFLIYPSLKNMAILLKHLDRTNEAIAVVNSKRNLCPNRFIREGIDYLLIDLNKEGIGEPRGNTIAEHIELLEQKLKRMGKPDQTREAIERIRLLNELAWFSDKQGYTSDEQRYRYALFVETDKNSQCDTAVYLIKNGCISEAKTLLQAIQPSSEELDVADSYIKSYARACEMLTEVGSEIVSKPLGSSINRDQIQGIGFSAPPRPYLPTNPQQYIDQPCMLDRDNNGFLGSGPEMNRGGGGGGPGGFQGFNHSPPMLNPSMISPCQKFNRHPPPMLNPYMVSGYHSSAMFNPSIVNPRPRPPPPPPMLKPYMVSAYHSSLMFNPSIVNPPPPPPPPPPPMLNPYMVSAYNSSAMFNPSIVNHPPPPPPPPMLNPYMVSAYHSSLMFNPSIVNPPPPPPPMLNPYRVSAYHSSPMFNPSIVNPYPPPPRFNPPMVSPNHHHHHPRFNPPMVNPNHHHHHHPRFNPPMVNHGPMFSGVGRVPPHFINNGGAGINVKREE